MDKDSSRYVTSIWRHIDMTRNKAWNEYNRIPNNLNHLNFQADANRFIQWLCRKHLIRCHPSNTSGRNGGGAWINVDDRGRGGGGGRSATNRASKNDFCLRFRIPYRSLTWQPPPSFHRLPDRDTFCVSGVFMQDARDTIRAPVDGRRGRSSKRTTLNKRGGSKKSVFARTSLMYNGWPYSIAYYIIV